MRVQYFSDTDTLYVVLNNNRVDDTRDLDENTLLEFDEGGNLVSLTIEHAKARVDITSFTFQQTAATEPAIPVAG